MRSLLTEYDHPDKVLYDDTLHGFPMAGKLPPCLLEADVMPKPKPVKSLEDFANERVACNKKILASLRESEFSADLMEIHEKDRVLGALGELTPMTDKLQEEAHLSRRIGVRELRAKGWRTRAVDDMTEMQMNPCTEQSDRQVNSDVAILLAGGM